MTDVKHLQSALGIFSQALLVALFIPFLLSTNCYEIETYSDSFNRNTPACIGVCLPLESFKCPSFHAYTDGFSIHTSNTWPSRSHYLIPYAVGVVATSRTVSNRGAGGARTAGSIRLLDLTAATAKRMCRLALRRSTTTECMTSSCLAKRNRTGTRRLRSRLERQTAIQATASRDARSLGSCQSFEQATHSGAGSRRSSRVRQHLQYGVSLIPSFVPSSLPSDGKLTSKQRTFAPFCKEAFGGETMRHHQNVSCAPASKFPSCSLRQESWWIFLTFSMIPSLRSAVCSAFRLPILEDLPNWTSLANTV